MSVDRRRTQPFMSWWCRCDRCDDYRSCDCSRWPAPSPEPEPVCTYLLNAPFTAADQGYVDGQSLDTVAEGITAGQLRVVEVDGTLAIVGNECAFTAQATPAWGDLGFYSQAVTRALGRGLLHTIGLSTRNLVMHGWFKGTAITAVDFEDSLIWSGGAPGTIFISADGTLVGPAISTTMAALTDYQYAMVLGGYDVNGVPWRSGQVAVNYTYGAGFFIKGGVYTNWTLVWRATTDNTATLYAVLSNHAAAGTLDDFRVWSCSLEAVLQPNNLSLFAAAGELDAYTPELGGAWTEDIGDWDTLGGTLTATTLGIATFTGLADCVYDAKITMPGAGVVAGGLVLRGSDYTGASEDYWYVKVTPGTAGTDFELIEYAAGAATQRAFADVDWVAATAYRIRAICYGQTIDCFHSKGTGGKITYALAASGEFATDFGLRDEGNANMTFDNVALYPRTSAVYDATLNAV